MHLDTSQNAQFVSRHSHTRLTGFRVENHTDHTRPISIFYKGEFQTRLERSMRVLETTLAFSNHLKTEI